ncbi:MAG: glycosyltransferase family 4 protein [Spirochaetota bacterium]
MNTVGIIAVAATTALVINLMCTPLILRLSHQHKWYDHSDHRKIHTEDTPRIGGIGIVASFVLASVGGIVWLASAAPAGTAGMTADIIRELGPVYAGLLVIFAVGIIDDFRNLRAMVKLCAQIVAGVLVSLSTFRISGLAIPGVGSLSFGILGYPLTVLWIVGLVNAMNFIDGMDGLAGSTSLVASIFLAIIAFILGNEPVGMLALVLSASLMGFLVFNAPPAKIFMGDSGSTSIGFLLAVLPLFGGTAASGEMGLVPTVTLLLVPVIDTAAAILRRMRKGVPVYRPDREHLHHKLLDLKFGTWKILLMVCGGGVLAGAAALAWVVAPAAIGIASVLSIWVIGVLCFLYLHKVRHGNI